jgi:hypothetical protein
MEFPLGFTTIGSGPECDVRLTGLCIEPLHACIIAGPRGVVLCDLSTAGIRVNGHVVRGAALLHDRDHLQIGGERFVVATTPMKKTSGGPRGNQTSARVHGALAADPKAEERPSGTYRAISTPMSLPGGT